MTSLVHRHLSSSSNHQAMSKVHPKRSPYSVVFIDEEGSLPPPPPISSKFQNVPKYSKLASTGGALRKKLLKYYSPCSFSDYLLSENSVLARLGASLVPPLVYPRFKRIAVDFEGTFLSIFLLASTIYWGLVSFNGINGNGTTSNNKILGKSTLGSTLTNSRLHSLLFSTTLSFGYVLTLSCATWALSKLTQTGISFRQIVSIMGYGLFGHALTLMICELFSDEWFIPLLIFVGGLDSSRIAIILLARTRIPGCRFIICTPISVIHLLYLVYLHFAIMRG